ncbi:MAG: CHAT domain-containing protein [bacterium]
MRVIKCRRLHFCISVVLVFLISRWIPLPLFAKSICCDEIFVNEPLQITFEADPLLYAALSKDAQWLIYTSGREEFSDLWLRCIEPGTFMLPERLTFNPASEFAPAFSPDNRYIAFVGTSYDAKGDIFLLDREARDEEPERLTGRDTGDGSPCFSPDGSTLYFHQTQPQDYTKRLAQLNLWEKGREPRYRDMGREGAFPAVSPYGGRIVFVSFGNDAGGDISMMDMATGTVSSLTQGPAIDLYPNWSEDGRYIYFSRFDLDTNGDGRVDHNDNARIFRREAEAGTLDAYPLTSSDYSAVQPRIFRGKIFFISTRTGVSNLWSLPCDGEIMPRPTVGEQMELAGKLSRLLPPQPHRAILAYYKVLEMFGEEEACAEAAYRIGEIFLTINNPHAAASFFQRAVTHQGPKGHWGALARIEEVLIDIKIKHERTHTDAERHTIRERGLGELDDIFMHNKGDLFVQARSLVAQSRLLLEYGRDAASLLRAIEILDRVRDEYPDQKETAAEAMVLKADAYSRIGQADEVYTTYYAVLDTYPTAMEWSDEAVGKILDLALGKAQSGELDKSIELLRRIVQESRKSRPSLAMGALNRIGDLYYRADKWYEAKSTYREVLDTFPPGSMQSAAARLSLAEIFYREERFRKALDLYEREVESRVSHDHIYRLARAGYIRKSIESGEALYRFGEIPAARKIFKELIDYDYSIVEAHRGYIMCAAAQKDSGQVLAVYREKLKEDPDDYITLYAMGLCLTYSEKKEALEEAGSLILRAISLKGQIEYFYQTMGYIFEVRETVYKERGNLEKAVEAYHKAYFLNDHKNNKANAANLLLNLGNAYYLLGQYGKAFHYYAGRLESGRPFDNKTAQIFFYRRFGACAFQINEIEKSMDAYKKVIDLIDKTMSPKEASTAFDSLIGYVRQEIIIPALKDDKKAGRAQSLRAHQLTISRTLFKVNQMEVGPPPDPAWQKYTKMMEELLEEQGKLIAKLHGIASDEALKNISFLMNRISEAIGYPSRLVQLRTEMRDRLGLAYQEAGEYEKAMEMFEEVFIMNQNLGLHQNLAKNRRSVAYNAYMSAEGVITEKKKELLTKAADDFHASIELVRKYGVGERKKDDQAGGIVNINLQVSLDDTDSTGAAHGFNAEQEIRLAEAFITRIKIELGELAPAEETIRKQLAHYPLPMNLMDVALRESDIYGVSLLYHRAGHLAAARGKPHEAIDYFANSAHLTLRMGNAVSSAINVGNMAHMLSLLSPYEVKMADYEKKLSRADRKVEELFSDEALPTDSFTKGFYHNLLGVHMLCLPCDVSGDEYGSAVMRIAVLQKAVVHFTKGLHALEQSGQIPDRQKSALICALWLNMAEVAQELGQADEAHEYYMKVLQLSHDVLLPEFEWRALAHLRRYAEGLKTLSSMTVLRAGCGPLEILTSFEELVVDLFKSHNYEAAFNMGESLSEFERVSRFSPLVREHVSSKDLEMCRRIYPRLLRIEQLTLLEGKEEEIRLLEESLAGKVAELSHLGEPGQVRKDTIIMLGLATHAEEIADAVVKERNEGKREQLRKEYRDLLKEYGRVAGESHAPLIGMVRAEPTETVDCMENLTDDTQLIRVFRVHNKEPGYILFCVTAYEISARWQKNIDTLDLSSEGPLYCAYEELKALPIASHCTYALSATHLMRSIGNRTPFKRALLTITDDATKKIIYNETYDTAYVTVDLPAQDIVKALPSAHMVILDTRVVSRSEVPTRAGEVSRPTISVELDRGRRLPFIRMAGHLSNLSCMIIPKSSIDDAYVIGHLLSLSGCPTLLMARQPLTKSNLTGPFLTAFSSISASDAFMSAYSDIKEDEGWLLIGYRGMSSQEAHAFAKKNFTRFVKDGQTALKEKNTEKALSLFENALLIANENTQYARYTKVLYHFARESAYASENLEKALHYAAALSQFLAAKHPDSEEHAEALLRLALIEARLEHYDKAIPALQEALEMMENLELDEKHASALASMGAVLEAATDYEKALGHFESAASLSKKLDKKILLTSQYNNIGRIYDLRLSQYIKARRSYEQALALYREMEDEEGSAQSLLNIGRCSRMLGHFFEADRCYEEALEIIKPTYESETDRPRLRSKIIIEQANNAWFQGRYQDAFTLQRSAYYLAEHHKWPLEQVIALNTSGLIWWTLGDNQRALRELNQALSLVKELKTRRDEEATTLNNIGLVYREMGRYKEACTTFDEALMIDRKIKSRWAIAYDLRNKALTLLRMGDAKSALPLFREACEETKAIGNRINEAKSLLGVAEAYEALDLTHDARLTFNHALDLSHAMNIRETKWRCLYGLARLALKDEDYTEAQRLLLEAIEVIEAMRSHIKVEQLRDGFIGNKLSVYETLIALLVERGDKRGAFEIAERCRARSFIDLLGNQRLTLYGAIDQTLYDRQKKLKAEIEEQEALRAQSTERDESEIFDRMLTRLNDRYNDLMREIQSSNPQLVSLVSVDPVKIEEIQSLLEQDAALLAYFALPQELLCWFITRAGIELYRTPVDRAVLGETIFEYRRMIQNLEPLQEHSEKLFAWLLSPLKPQLTDIKYCGIVPHNTLHYLSFATLSDGNNYLIDTLSLFYLPSASVLRYTVKRRSKDKNHHVLAIGNPDLGDSALALPFSEHEVDTIKWNFPDITILTHDKASEGWIMDEIDKFGIIHFASHGEFDPINPLFSAIKLAKDEKSDGDLEASEVFGIKINADLVVLSACQTGLGKVTHGDEVIGLNRAFFYAGTHALISSLWRVSDISTALLIKKFYREYAQDNKADSLRQAVVHVKNRYPHPGYWGAFVLTGDYY